MTPVPHGLSGEDVGRALERGGFVHVSTKGSHAKYRDGHGHTVIIPMHRELAPGTLRSILRQAGWDVETLQSHL
ncbi:type II toxin-antitoxin system HicA family toxin [Carbonactinospora thermoautotrophica]|uniref:type II toxin-antitoxin system HicA family toxin n=1 Tax=Carbonactinospora thermoautotrophica TaxID=1469144 RepID=UPI00099F0271|nr:type II toxin-antitoxin system HicA family toxin [Carbonactinospora thermoautotrophica]